MATTTVLFSHGPLKATDNPYLHELVDGLTATETVATLTPLSAVRPLPDVFHVHWPKHLIRGANRLRTVVKFLSSTLLLARIRRHGIPVVQTVHNRADHDGEGRLERWLFAKLDALVSLRVYLNESEENDYRTGVVALHGTYRDWLVQHAGLHHPLPSPSKDVLLFGLLRPYKGIETLVAAAEGAECGLTLAGRAESEEYAGQVRRWADQPGGPSLLEGHVSDPDLVDLISHHKLVVLPYRAMYNSGALLFALSVGRPVMAPWTPANASLQEEFGSQWIHLYRGDLTASALRQVLAEVTTVPDVPEMGRRSWSESIAIHREIYSTITAGPAVENRRRLEQSTSVAAHSPKNLPTV